MKPRYRFYVEFAGGAWLLMEQFDSKGNSLYQPEQWPRFITVAPSTRRVTHATTKKEPQK